MHVQSLGKLIPIQRCLLATSKDQELIPIQRCLLATSKYQEILLESMPIIFDKSICSFFSFECAANKPRSRRVSHHDC